MQRQTSAGLPTWRTVALWIVALMLGSCASTKDNAWVELRSDPTAAGPLVQITGTRASVSGTVNYRERMALPLDAVVEVQLLDVSRQDAPALIIATASVFTHDRQVPIPFTLVYDPEKIFEKHTYAVRAVIRSEGAMIFTTTSRYPVITRGSPSQADLMLERVGKTKAR